MPKSVKGWLTSDYFKSQVALVLPKHMTPERFVRVAITCLTRIPKLGQCSPESVLRCMMACSELGLEPDGRRAHLIPFGQECTLIVDYKGMVELAMRSGTVSSIFAQTVCDNDVFDYDTGEIHHKIDFKRDRGSMYAVYTVVKFKDGGQHTEVMTKADVDRIRNRSKAKSNGPWVTDYDEMAKKTVFRRASKWIVLSPEIQDALEKDADVAPGGLVAEAAANMIDFPEPPEKAPASAPIDVPTTAAPSEAPTTPETPSEAPKEGKTPQDELADLIIGAGYGFSDFAEWAEGSGNLPDAKSLPDFNAVPAAVAKRLLKAKVGLIKGLAETKGLPA